MSSVDPTRSKIQLEVLKERIKALEERNKQQEKDLLQAQSNTQQKDTELATVRGERDDLRIKWAVIEAEMKHLQGTITLTSQSGIKKRSFIKRQGFLAAPIFFLSTVLASVGTNLLTQKPPDVAVGGVMMGLAFVAYVIGTLMTTLFAGGEN